MIELVPVREEKVIPLCNKYGAWMFKDFTEADLTVAEVLYILAFLGMYFGKRREEEMNE
jgi:hypothetical protein